MDRIEYSNTVTLTELPGQYIVEYKGIAIYRDYSKHYALEKVKEALTW